MLAPKGGNDGSVVPFTAAEGSNSNTNFSTARDGQCTPVPPQQRLNSWALPRAPETPAKQRRTRHEERGGQTITYLSGGASHKRGAAPDRRCNLASRKRPSSELSQFSALRLDDPSDTVPFPPPECSTSEATRSCLRPHLGPLATGGMSLMNSAPNSPQRDWMARVGSSFPFMPYSPDQPEYSQAESEFSNIFNRRILTDYKEVKELGFGSFGRVTLYEETGTGALVAVKTSPPNASREQRQRFARERAVMSITKGFPHVVQLLDSWEEGHAPQVFLQLEYCSGGSVAERAEQRRQRGEVWDERELFVFFGHMALALDALHSANIVHVDFKPDNVLIDEAGDYKLSDFGCSVFVDDDGFPRKTFAAAGAKTGNLFSAPSSTAGVNNNSMADAGPLSFPTQLSVVSVEEGDCRYLCMDMLNQKRYLKEGDMFSFGISLFELMSGEPLPHHGAGFLELRQHPPLHLLERRGYSKRLTAFVAELMHAEPTSRPTAHDALCFFQLPPHVPQVMSQWVVGDTPPLDSQVGEDETNLLLDVRYTHAALEVAARILDKARRLLRRGSIASSQSTGVAAGRRVFAEADGMCTPKDPATDQNSQGDRGDSAKF